MIRPSSVCFRFLTGKGDDWPIYDTKKLTPEVIETIKGLPKRTAVEVQRRHYDRARRKAVGFTFSAGARSPA
jgi:hypothetical protein